MPIPRFEVASGTIDGANKTFTVSRPYLPGTTAVFLNGQLLRADYANGWVELDSTLGKFEMNEAPFVADVVQVFFLDTSPISPGEEVTPLSGTIVGLDSEVVGTYAEVGAVAGSIAAPELLTGTLSQLDAIASTLVEVENLVARVNPCEVC